jgi:hypothetical protein
VTGARIRPSRALPHAVLRDQPAADWTSIRRAQRGRSRRPDLTAEDRPGYGVGAALDAGARSTTEAASGAAASGASSSGAAASSAPSSGVAASSGDPVDVLRTTIRAIGGAVDGIDLDALEDAALDDVLRLVQQGMDRLDALRCFAAGARETRALRAAGAGREGRALREVRQGLQEDLGLSPSEAKKLGETGRRAGEAPQAKRSLQQGKVRPEHVAIITDTLRWLDGDDRERVEEQLVEAAANCSVLELGRLARRLLAEVDQSSAVEAVKRRHDRRSAKVVEKPDGMTDIYARLSDLEAELAHTTIHAFRRPDAPGEHRTPEQATADALIDIFNAALRSQAAPTQHGERPHITITIPAANLEAGTGVGETMFTGSVPATEVQRLARDAKLRWVTVDPKGVPVNVSEGRSVVRSAIWQALLVRDRGCRWPGCDSPPSWCDVAHAEVPDRDGGPVVLSNVALLCRRHHRMVDRDKWTMRIRGPDVIFDPPDGSRQERRISTGPNR